MPEDIYPRDATARKIAEPQTADQPWPVSRSAEEAPNLSAYNQTRQRFLSAEVESADFSPAILNDRVPALTAQSGRALWIIPFRGIASTCIRVPIDLLYLDKYSCVIEAVESFPIFQPTPSKPPADSVLALPAGTIASTGTAAGDRLHLGLPEQMKQYLLVQQAVASNDSLNQPSEVSSQAEEAAKDMSQRMTGRVLPWVDIATPKLLLDPIREPSPQSSRGAQASNAAPAAPVADAAIAAEAAPAANHAPVTPDPVPELSPRQKAMKSRSWLQRLLSGDPDEPRTAPREPLDWIAAYFFTGGAPIAHSVRNISATGLYIFTEERWSPGTILRTTLADRREPTPERSITVNAKVVRWGNDGIGMQFVLTDPKERRHNRSVGDSMTTVSKAHIEKFLRLLKNSPA